MTATLPSRPSYRWLSITLLVAAVVYGWYALSQYDRLNDLNQRQLSNAAAELKIGLNNAAETIRQFNDKWNKFSEPAGVRAAANQNGKAIAGAPRLTLEQQPRVCDFVRGQPYLELPSCASDDAVEWKRFTKVQWDTTPSLGVTVSNGTDSAQFRYRIERLLQELAFPDAFELTFVATDTGTVLFQDSPTRRRWLRHLRWSERTFRDAYADRPPLFQIHNVQELIGADWSKLKSASSRVSVDLGGSTQQVYLQPFALVGETTINLIVGGAVPRTTVVRDALALGTPLLGLLVFLVLVAALGFPFVKLGCLDMHERFTLTDIKLLYASSGALLVLFTCASLAADGYARWRLSADRGLIPLAEHLESGFIKEIGAIRDQLVEYDGSIEQSALVPCEDWTVETHWFERRGAALPWPREVHLKAVAWIEPGGTQIWKSTFDAVPGKLRVGHRPYFRAVRDGNLFQIDGRGAPFFFAPDRSINDGRFYTFVSMKSSISPRLCDPVTSRAASVVGVPVISATAQLLSLDRQPMPAGYGFALINREGRVLFHSDDRLSLRENLYDELSDGGQARAMAYAGHGGGLDARYRERPHRLYLHPVRFSRAIDRPRPLADHHSAARTDAGFNLVVFRDTSVDQALVGHVFAVGLVGPIVFVLLLSAAGLVILCRAARGKPYKWSVWLWPHQALNDVYQRQVIAFLALLAVCIALFLKFASPVPFLFVPLAAIVLGLGIHWYWAPSQGCRTKLSTPIWQTSSVFLMVICLIVVPSGALFRLTLNHEFAKLIVTERAWLETQAQDGLQAMSVEASADRYAQERTREVLAARAAYVACVPAPFDAPPPVHALPPVDARQARVELVSAPLSTESVIASPAHCASTRSPTAASLQPMGILQNVVHMLHAVDGVLPIENEILARQVFQDAGHAFSPEGTLVWWFRASAMAFIGLAVLFLLLYRWIRWNTDHLFFANLDAPRSSPTDSFDTLWDQCTPDEQMVLVQIACERIANPYQRPVVEAMLRRGLLQLDPDIQPFSRAFEQFLRSKEKTLNDEIRKWHEVNALHSWRYARLILAVVVGAVGAFLVATQPGLQSGVIAVATAMTGALTAGAKLREAMTSWFARKGSNQ